MKKRKLGRSGLLVSPISLGCWALAGDATWGEQDERASIATVHAALDAGINFFDTAEMYSEGRSEEILGKALKGVRSNTVIASKVMSSNLGGEALRTACENSLRRLKTDYIDVYYIHWPNEEIPIEETMNTLESLKREGKIRVAACSNFGVRDLSELLAAGRVEANQLAYNLLFRAIEYEIQRMCADEEIGIVCYSPLAQGLLTGKFESAGQVPVGRARTRHFSSHRPGVDHDEPGWEKEVFEAIRDLREICREQGIGMAEASLAWLLSRKGVSSVIAGARNPSQVMENAKATDVKLSDEVLTAMTQVTDALKELMGPNPDMWRTKSRIR